MQDVLGLGRCERSAYASVGARAADDDAGARGNGEGDEPLHVDIAVAEPIDPTHQPDRILGRDGTRRRDHRCRDEDPLTPSSRRISLVSRRRFPGLSRPGFIALPPPAIHTLPRVFTVVIVYVLSPLPAAPAAATRRTAAIATSTPRDAASVHAWRLFSFMEDLLNLTTGFLPAAPTIPPPRPSPPGAHVPTSREDAPLMRCRRFRSRSRVAGRSRRSVVCGRASGGWRGGLGRR